MRLCGVHVHISSTGTAGRKVFAGCTLVLLAACVCAVFTSSSGRTVMLAKTRLPTAEAPAETVFTSVDAQRIDKQLSEHAEGREAAFERQVETLRRAAARDHEVHEQAVRKDMAKDAQRVLVLDSRTLPAVFDSKDGRAQLAAATTQAAQHEHMLQIRISKYQRLGAMAHSEHEALLKANEKSSWTSEAQMKGEVAKKMDQADAGPAQQVMDEKEAASYAAAHEQQFETSVVKYRKAEAVLSAAHKAQLAADQKARAPEIHKLVEDALAPALAAEASNTRGGGNITLKPLAAVDMKEIATRHMRQTHTKLGINAEHMKLDAAQKHQVERQLDFKKEVKEESEKAERSSFVRNKAAIDALHKMHAQVHVFFHLQTRFYRTIFSRLRE